MSIWNHSIVNQNYIENEALVSRVDFRVGIMRKPNSIIVLIMHKMHNNNMLSSMIAMINNML